MFIYIFYVSFFFGKTHIIWRDVTCHLWFWLQNSYASNLLNLRKSKRRCDKSFFTVTFPFCLFSDAKITWYSGRDISIWSSPFDWMRNTKHTIHTLLSLSMLSHFLQNYDFDDQVERKRNRWKWNESELEHIVLIHTLFVCFSRSVLNYTKIFSRKKRHEKSYVCVVCLHCAIFFSLVWVSWVVQ